MREGKCDRRNTLKKRETQIRGAGTKDEKDKLLRSLNTHLQTGRETRAQRGADIKGMQTPA